MANTNLYHMGERIAALRKAKHMTQENLAEYLDISIKHCSEVERGLTTLSMERLILLAKLYNCTLDHLILGSNSDDISFTFPATMIEIMRSDNEREKALLQRYLQMYEELRKTPAFNDECDTEA